jgi:hypothetical protein
MVDNGRRLRSAIEDEHLLVFLDHLPHFFRH